VRHHAVAFETDAQVPMALDVDSGWSVRPVVPEGLLDGRHRGIALGSQHAVGADNTSAAGALHRWVTDTWDATIIDAWSSQDVFVDDHLPIIGRVGGVDRVLTATGFGGWGLALGTAAGLDLAERLSTDRERWGFWSLTPKRLTGLAPAVATQGAQGAARLVSGNVGSALSSDADADALTPGQGVVIRQGTDVVARSVDAEGHAHAVTARCTHMGCIVSWNHEAQSWDCGCHGSRFSPAGAVLHGPAVDPLAPAPW
jgi:nitrite reductase/ring-hydroxylating ferredoxin subunit